MVDALRQLHRLVAQVERPIVMAEVEMTPCQVGVAVDATVPPQRACEGRMFAGIVERGGLPVMLRRSGEAAPIEVREAHHDVGQQEVERIARALGRRQSVLSDRLARSEEHTSELQSPYVISYAV